MSGLCSRGFERVSWIQYVIFDALFLVCSCFCASTITFHVSTSSSTFVEVNIVLCFHTRGSTFVECTLSLGLRVRESDSRVRGVLASLLSALTDKAPRWWSIDSAWTVSNLDYGFRHFSTILYITSFVLEGELQGFSRQIDLVTIF